MAACTMHRCASRSIALFLVLQIGSLQAVAGLRSGAAQAHLVDAAEAVAAAAPALVEAAPWESQHFDLQGTWVGASTGDRYTFTKLGNTRDVEMEVYECGSLSTDGWILTPVPPLARSPGSRCFEAHNKYSIFQGEHSMWCIEPASHHLDEPSCMDIGPHQDLCKNAVLPAEGRDVPMRMAGARQVAGGALAGY